MPAVSYLPALRLAKTAKVQDKAKHIATAQSELRKLNPKQHGKLINALQAKVLALQGRGGDTSVAHLEPGEMVVPRAVLTPELAQLIAAEAAKHGIDPKQLIVGSRSASINPATGAEEFGVWETVKGWFGSADNSPSEIEPITVSATRRKESLERGRNNSLFDKLASHGNWCGPGGGGETKGPVDALCKTHDECFGDLGVDSRTFMDGKFDPSKTGDLQKCNQAFVDGLNEVREPNLHGRLYGPAAREFFTEFVPKGTRATMKNRGLMPDFYNGILRLPQTGP